MELDQLPNELLLLIITFAYPYKTCDLFWFYSLCRISKKWYSIINSHYLYHSIIKLGNYPINSYEIQSIEDIQQITNEITQHYCIEKNYDSRILDLFNEDCVNNITKIPVFYNLPFEIIESPEKLYDNSNIKILNNLLNHSSPLLRGITNTKIHFLSFRIYDSSTKKKKIEFLFQDKKEPYFDTIRNRFMNIYPEWSFSATNKSEIQYLGDLGLRIKKEIFEKDNIASYLWGKPLDIVSLDYIKRLIIKENCGYIVPKTYIIKNNSPQSIIEFYVECDDMFNRIDEEILLTEPLVYLD